MKTYKRTRITVETEQVLMVQRRSSNRGWCPECSRVVQMLRFAEAAALAGVALGVLRECARTASWHLTEAQDGTPMICLDSLLKAQADMNRIEQKKDEQ